MGGINTGRWVLGGVVAGIVVWIVDRIESVWSMGGMAAAVDVRGPSVVGACLRLEA